MSESNQYFNLNSNLKFELLKNFKNISRRLCGHEVDRKNVYVSIYFSYKTFSNNNNPLKFNIAQVNKR